MSRKAMRRPVNALTALRDDNLELAAVRAELDVAPRAACAARCCAGTQFVSDRGDRRFGIFDVAKDRAGEVAQHLVEPHALEEMQREGEVGSGHGARFYSERWSNSTRARAQSAAICAFRRSNESNARSSRIRCTKPTRSVVP